MAASLHLRSSLAKNDVEFWNLDRPKDMANIASLEVMCGKTHMEVQISFDRPFNGIIFSKGAVDQYNCIYVKPQTGATTYSFNIMYNQVKRYRGALAWHLSLLFICEASLHQTSSPTAAHYYSFEP